MTLRRKSKIRAVQTAFSYEGTINQPTDHQNIVSPEENAVGITVILYYNDDNDD